MKAYVDCVKKYLLDSISSITDGGYCQPAKPKPMITCHSSSESADHDGIHTLESLREEVLGERNSHNLKGPYRSSDSLSVGSLDNDGTCPYVSDYTQMDNEIQKQPIPPNNASYTQFMTSNPHYSGYNSDDEAKLFDSILEEGFLNEVNDMGLSPTSQAFQEKSAEEREAVIAKSNITATAIDVAKSTDTSMFVKAPVIAPTKAVLDGWMKHLVRVSDDTVSPDEYAGHDDIKVENDTNTDSQPDKRSKIEVSVKVLKKAFGFK